MVGLIIITNFKRRNITQYLVYEGLDVVGKVALPDDAEILSLMKPPNCVWLWVQCGQ